MPENMHDKCEIANDIPDDMYPILDLDSGFDLLTYDNIRVEGNVTSCPLFEEALDFDNLFSDPRIKKSLGGDECSITPMAMKEHRSVIKCSNSADGCFGLLTDDCGILNSIAAHGGKPEINFEFSDGLFRGQEDCNMYLTRDVLGSTSHDFLLDDGSSQKGLFLKYVPIEDSSLQKSQSGCHVQNLENDSGLVETSKCSKPVAPPHSESKSEQNVSFLDNMSIDELHEVFRSTFGRDTFIDDREWLKRRVMFGLQSTKEMDTDSSITESRSSSNEHNDNSIFCTNFDRPPKSLNCGSHADINDSEKSLPKDDDKVGNADEKSGMICVSELDTVKALDLGVKDGELTSRKRLRKPTRRYIEELSEKKSKNFNSQKAESHNKKHSKESKDVMELVQSHCDSPILMGDQLLSSTAGPRRGRPRKNCTLLVRVTKGNKELKAHSFRPSRRTSDGFRNFESALEDDGMSAASDSNCKISKAGSGGRRKHHRQWTLSEVMKLIEGVSQHGVGRWTEIKRHLFSSSNYRTSVDLKDKWRNLLRATGAHIHGKKEVESSKKQHMSLQIPQSVSRRVRELSTIYPYPRERKSSSQLIASGTNINTNTSLISTMEMVCESSDYGG